MPPVPPATKPQHLILIPLPGLPVHSRLSTLEHILPEFIRNRAIKDVTVIRRAVAVQMPEEPLPRGWGLCICGIRQAGVFGEDVVVDGGAVDC